MTKPDKIHTIVKEALKLLEGFLDGRVDITPVKLGEEGNLTQKEGFTFEFNQAELSLPLDEISTMYLSLAMQCVANRIVERADGRALICGAPVPSPVSGFVDFIYVQRTPKLGLLAEDRFNMIMNRHVLNVSVAFDYADTVYETT